VPRLRAQRTGHADELSLVGHLDELRTRIIVSACVLLVAVGLCFWQNDLLLAIANGPLPNGREPITFGVTEPFTTTLTVSAYGAILLTFPLLIYELYAFVLPALTPGEKRTLIPFMLGAPLLFIGGVVFAYFVVVPAAAQFLLNFNQDDFNIQIRAKEYYSFFSLALISVGVLYELPLGILAVVRLGIFTPQQIADNRRYAVLVIAVLAMLLPGTDPVTMLIAMVPLLVLFEGSLLLARLLQPSWQREGEEGDSETPTDPAAPGEAAG
jgi:sec-independent protein translocase protein TatC